MSDDRTIPGLGLDRLKVRGRDVATGAQPIGKGSRRVRPGEDIRRQKGTESGTPSIKAGSTAPKYSKLLVLNWSFFVQPIEPS